MNPDYSITRAKAGKIIGMSAALNYNDTYAAFSHFCWYVHENGKGQRWYGQTIDGCVQGVELVKLQSMESREYCIITAEGDVIFLLPGGLRKERILESGLSAPDSKHFGRMQDIQAIDGQLFACGDGAQIYHRDDRADWRCLDPMRRQPPGTLPANYISLFRVNGPSKDDVYVAGSDGTLLHWDGKYVSVVDTGCKANLIDIFVESSSRIWICGGEGTLLLGNCRDGFKKCNGDFGGALFQRMTSYDNKLFLAASAGEPAGLFIYDNNHLNVVKTGLLPEPSHPHIVQAAEGVLWVISVDDIVRFDGSAWERVDDFPKTRGKP